MISVPFVRFFWLDESLLYFVVLYDSKLCAYIKSVNIVPDG